MSIPEDSKDYIPEDPRWTKSVAKSTVRRVVNKVEYDKLKKEVEKLKETLSTIHSIVRHDRTDGTTYGAGVKDCMKISKIIEEQG